ncbi:alpha-1,6-glucosidases, pullulanase-type [Pedococcus dokdonensis]|uniref:Alpha-1,6-glucosidases, pullulanase-type n=1 Tax=Pedococcus dokdonensis TaxID=443156 RepID=A0A1H0KKX6_9MICO|nr:pullulanase-type alpha-1,6-glucosidase [Pedococcus dokdonensis]SDO56410.1 alpha-1,6-glucosidases, pullulanase-type [Pedococcus dokdonensis]
MRGPRRPYAVLVGMALLIAGAGVPLAAPATAADPAPRTATLAGSLQSELGCPADWSPDCTSTDLAQVGNTTAYAKVFDVPAGSYEFKVAIDHSWDENYGADGVKNGANIPLVLKGPARLEFSYDDATHQVGIRPLNLSGRATRADNAYAADSLREPLTKERYYFVMTDRFANGDTANDRGGLTGDKSVTGYDPTNNGYYHGGDLKGLQGKLDYIKGLGTTAIWLTPSFKNRPVQGAPPNDSAGYHGYWITDFTQIDPHLGTNADLTALIAAAHGKGMKVFFDIITNHTADVINYSEGQYTYRNKTDYPYKDAAGNVFDDKTYAGKPNFPALDPATSFPYHPVFTNPADATVKVPAWLNDVTKYHNRGDSTFAGESSEYGDFVGLDDLFTEQADVEKGMEDIYKAWVDFGVDGFRIDTVKHVNTEFWQKFSPAMLERAKQNGNPDFFMFGEVYDSRPSYMSTFTTTGKLQATLDFGFQSQAVNWAQSKSGTDLRDLYADDDYYTDTDSNAYELPTFLGNHDMGRVAMMLKGPSADDADLMRRVKLADSLMYLTRGQPITYYGDEQGFMGSGGDKAARQDMFATQTPSYATEQVLGDTSGAKARYNTSAPLYQHIKTLAALRAAHPALADGAQIHRYASSNAGIFAFSRIDKDKRTEYVVALNNATTAKSAGFATYGHNQTFAPLYGAGGSVRSAKDGRLTVTVPAQSVSVWKATSPMDRPKSAPAVYLTSPGAGDVVGGRAEIGAAIPDDTFAQVSFLARPVGTTAWTKLGTDDNAPYRVFHDVSDATVWPKGTLVEYRAVAKDSVGHISASSSYGVVGDPKSGGGGSVGPVTQPDAVSVPGDHNSEMGCGGDWAPDCDQAQLTLDTKDQIWKGTYTTVPAGPYAYKVAINKSWDENYGAGGVPGGDNISYTMPADGNTFYYDHATHYVTSKAQGPIVTAPGSFQSELGCPADWSPDCMRPWLQDPDGDGTYTWSTTEMPAGTYEFKVAHGLNWDENYGAGGAPGGANISLTVPADGMVVTISYAIGTHVATAKAVKAGAAPDLTKQRAVWVSKDLVAVPADMASGANPALLRWRLAWSPTGGLSVDAEDITGGSWAPLSWDPRGLSASVVKAHPELAGYLALRLDDKTAKKAPDILKGQVAVGVFDTLNRVLDATGVQTAYVLDNLYAASASQRAYGVTFGGRSPTYRVWAPTAQKVDLLTWPAGAAGNAPVSSATRTHLTRASDGSWSGSVGAKNARYLYEVTVYVPSTGKVQTTQVTDPYSVALTLDSTRSVAVDLKDPAYQPSTWRTAKAPALAKDVDSTIYELHVRDFSVNDPTVSAQNRGSYLAFAENGNGTKHLKALAAAGLNTVHLLPTFDIASIPEDPADQQSPACDLKSSAPDSEEQQACIDAIRAKDAFNWGYDPWHWMAPEGSYASTPAKADGGARVAEFRTMVGGLHRDGLRVVLDQVFNHTPTSGQAQTSVLDKVVPGYYQRLNATGAVETSTCCQNVATEHAMAQKAMVDAVVLWARDYKVDGFRFDLMGHHSKANMLAVRSALDQLTLKKDGVDGKSVYVYGEGWNFGEVANNARFVQATQGQLGGTGIGTFSDRLRDAVRGGGPFDDDPRKQGFGSGESTDSNGVPFSGYDPVESLKHDTDLVELGLAGNLRSFTFRLNEDGTVATGKDVDYNGQPAGYADQPDEVITYVDAHDNETLFDSLTYKLPVATSMSDRVRMNTLSLATTALSQTPSFWHAGADLLRSKSLDRNSYDSSDWFNTLDWTGADNGFGHGLPLKGDNSAKWPIQKPLLANTALKPAATDVQQATAQAQDLLRLRFSTRLFRLGTASAINAKVSFPASGTADAQPGVIAMRIDDTKGTDADPQLKGLVVVFNASPTAVNQKVPGLAGATLSLSPVQQSGSDAVVKTSTWNATAGTATVPPRTVAVFVQR